MPGMTTTVVTGRLELGDILYPGERLLWSGRPEYGRRFLEPVGDERTWHAGLLAGATVMWATLPFINGDGGVDAGDAVWAYGAMTVLFGLWSQYLAHSRQYVLSNLLYFVTGERAIICRRGRNWRGAERMYVVSVPHAPTTPYEILPGRPHPSLRVGTMFSEDQVQPFGSGLSHPGHPILWGRINSPITLDYISDAEHVLGIIRSCLRRRTTVPSVR